MASISTLSALLKDFYLSPLQEQLNQEILVYQMFEKAVVSWSGKQVVIPVHVARNTGVGFAADDGTLPTAGSQNFEQLLVSAKFLYGRFNITGPAIASAKSGGNAFISDVEAVMDKLADDVKNAANARAVFGGRVIGYCHKQANTADQSYSGRTTGLQVGNATDTVDIVRLDTYATVEANVQVNAVTTSTITFSAAKDLSAATLVNAPTDCVFALVATANSTIVGGVAGAWDNEFSGITTNLATKSHFGVDRTTATGSSILQAIHKKVSETAATGYASLTLDRLQAILDSLLDTSDSAPDVILMNPVMRQEYTSLLVGSSAANLYVATDKATTGDGGFTGLAYGNIPMKTSKDMFKGTFFFLNTKSWKLCELEKPGFADLDGAILSRVANQDKWEGFFRLYCNVVCLRPNRNAVLTGISF